MSYDRPNILLITADQCRYDAIAANGNPAIRTPNLDRLVARGVSFERAYTESPVCVPARTGILTGKLPHRSGVFSNQTPLKVGTPTFVRDLASAGYHTQAIGKMHFRPSRADHGFARLWLSEENPPVVANDDYLSDLIAAGYHHVLETAGVRHELYYSPQPSQLPADKHPTAWTGDRTVQYLRERTDDPQPFFCWTSFIKPHPPFDPAAPYYLWYDPLEMPDPVRSDGEREHLGFHAYNQHRVKWTHPDMDLDRVRTMRAYYYACVSQMDVEIGKILDQLDASGQADNTLIVFTADHGEYLGDHWMFGKRGFHDPSARLPFVVAGPGVRAVARSDALVGLTDIAPTLLSAAGVDEMTIDPDGHDFLPVAAGDAPAIRDVFYGQFHHRALGIYMSMDGRAKYTYSAADRSEALYKVGSDETVNLIDDPAWADDAVRLRASLCDRMTADGYDEAFDGDRWREYPQPKLPALPGSADRDPSGRGRQYPTWEPNPGVDRIEPPDAYA